MDSLQDKLGMDYADEFEMQLVNLRSNKFLAKHFVIKTSDKK